VARLWNERALAAIRVDTPHPPAQARNCFSLSVAMYDAWAAYDQVSEGYVYRGKHEATDVEAARREAISHAAWRLLRERHAYSRSAALSLAADDTLLTELGYDTNQFVADSFSPAGIGNTVYEAVSAWFLNDGANQLAGVAYPFANPPVAYPDYPTTQGGYVYLNPPLAVALPGISDGRGNTVLDINHWQRLQIVNATDQHGFPVSSTQGYLGAQWLQVRPFALERGEPGVPWIDPGPPPLFGGATHARFVREAVAIITADGQLDPDDGEWLDISPGAYGHNNLEFEGEYGNGEFRIYDGRGHPLNPVTGEPYPAQLVRRGDYARVVAEYWADGPNSETPPGHWNALANQVSEHPLLVKKIGGAGPLVDPLEWDVKMYFALNAALHDAACAAWGIKRYYDGWRPIGAVRYLAGLGQSSDQGMPSFHEQGLPLIPGQIELVTESTVAIGRHAGLTPGKIALRAWPGPPLDSTNHHSGVSWIHGESWSTYQRTNFVSPAFPGYVSGHSTFSRAAAEVLAWFTGSLYFPGGLWEHAGFALGFEQGPLEPVTLQWATYLDAADEAGISRIWGGIHPPIDNLNGRRVGEKVGKNAWALAEQYFSGTVAHHPVRITLADAGAGHCAIQCRARRGLYYRLQSTADLREPFADETDALIHAKDTRVTWNTLIGGTRMFYRVIASPVP
jgi:hypothetical protein